MPINFTVKAFVEEQVVARGEQALEQYRAAEAAVLPFLESPAAYRRALDNNNNNNNNNGGGNGNGGAGAGGGNGTSLASRLRPAWNWFKWTVIIVTEFGAFVVSLKELLDSNQPARNRRYQRIV